ncbi:Ubiquitin fusion degradation protein 4 [Coemansia sp. RSA 989]|nr:Ubiquitin fusion degradation protein 4 [Coemansia sp. RSA 1086]KAJ1750418.1 Ubiquitin fusion degradation protein 4 [Coemansia sp. RSA 1821]KAJ1865120.1 Ubiquitin fusion degradation protein 4 [Coemansia sp. RSA 989]KAJ1875002.1 Ubiquitin fusion degradation protein 4 [Coemansia sp. RSA 990]
MYLCRTPGGRRILAASGDDSPLPPLVEVPSDESPAAIPLVSSEGSDIHSSLNPEIVGSGSGSPQNNLDSMDVDVRESSSSSSSSESDSHGSDSESDSSASEDKSTNHSSADEASEHSRLFATGLGNIARMANAQRFRPLLAALRSPGDDMQQMVALQELSEVLSISMEESLIGVDVGELVQALIALVGGEGLAAGNATVMLLACRCLSNLLEALPLSGSILLRHGALDVLCGRLLDIEYIDVAEQALTVLTQLSHDFGARVWEAGGLSASLMFLDFFATATQHKALRCAVNCTRSILPDQFTQAIDVVSVLERTVFYSDPQTADLSCTALLNIISAFRSSSERIQRLISADLLQRVLASIRNDESVLLLRLLVAVSSSSCECAIRLLDLDALAIASSILSAHCVDLHKTSDAKGSGHERPLMHMSEQAWEALRLVLVLLPRLPTSAESFARMASLINGSQKATEDSEAEGTGLLHLQAIYASTTILDQLQNALPLLMARIFTTTINLPAKYQALMVTLKVVFCLDADRLRDALDTIDLLRIVVGTISLNDSPLLSGLSLLIIRLVLDKLPGHYQRRFIREGMLDTLAAMERVPATAEPQSGLNSRSSGSESEDPSETLSANSVDNMLLLRGFKLVNIHVPASARNGAIITSQKPLFVGAQSGSYSGSGSSISNLVKWISDQACHLRQTLHAEISETAYTQTGHLQQLKQISEQFSSADGTAESLQAAANALAQCLLSSDGVTSYELLQSGLILALVSALEKATDPKSAIINPLRRCQQSELNSLSASAVGVLISRLQEALGTVEQLHVREAYRTRSDETHSPAHMLSKQIRFSVSPATSRGSTDPTMMDHMEQIRQAFQTIRVSVHAVSSFAVLETYLRPRVTLLLRNRRRRRRQRDLSVQSEAADASGGSRASTSRPQQTRLKRMEDANSSEDSENASDSSHSHGHLRMLQMIAQASGIDIRAAGLFENLDTSGCQPSYESDTSEEEEGEEEEGAEIQQDAKAADYQGDLSSRPGNWHMVFVLRVGDTKTEVKASDNIFRVIYGLCERSPALKEENPWMQTFELEFYVESGPSATATETCPLVSSVKTDSIGIGPSGAAIVHLLKILYDLLQCTLEADTLSRLFTNHSITAKAARQLEDPLMVVCSALPDWCYQLVSIAPFLLSFETRLAFFQATCFGYSRNINYWQTRARSHLHEAGSSRSSDNIQIPLGHVQRQKVRISRRHMLESALKMLDLYGTSKSILEVEYYDEVGSGVGPTLEFYATISHCLQEHDLGLWRDERTVNDEGKGKYVYAPHGLFPAPLGSKQSSPEEQSKSPDTLPPKDRVIQLFKFTGHLIAKGLIDGRILDIPLSAAFWIAVQLHLRSSLVSSSNVWSWDQIENVDPPLAKSLRYLQDFVDAKSALYARTDLSLAQKQAETAALCHPTDQAAVDDLTLDFTLPGFPEIELRPGGAEIPVTINNVHTYIDLVARWTLIDGIQAQVSAFCEGFDRVFSSKSLLMFTADELCCLVGHTDADDAYWTAAAVQSSIGVEQGFMMSSPEVCMFVEFLVSLDRKERRQFLRFATGASRLPLGGFAALHPPLRLAPRPVVAPLQPDDYLPSVMTCMNLIKLPKYSSLAVLKQRWKQVMEEGQQSFHLS